MNATHTLAEHIASARNGRAVPSVLSLFAGIGGFDLGLERAGMKVIAQCEIDPYCRAVLRKHWPEVPIYHDVRELTGEKLRADGIKCDVICGGFPCQDVSYAGKGLGLAGERSGLWREYCRLISEVRPRIAIVENVAALNFRGLGQILEELTALGYDAEWHVIPASSVGAPHERERCWVIAYPAHESWLYQSDIAQAAKRLCDNGAAWQACPWQAPASTVCGVDDGVSDRVDRTSALGNAVVPQIPEIIGRAILAAQSTSMARAA